MNVAASRTHSVQASRAERSQQADGAVFNLPEHRQSPPFCRYAQIWQNILWYRVPKTLEKLILFLETSYSIHTNAYRRCLQFARTHTLQCWKSLWPKPARWCFHIYQCHWIEQQHWRSLSSISLRMGRFSSCQFAEICQEDNSGDLM